MTTENTNANVETSTETQAVKRVSRKERRAAGSLPASEVQRREEEAALKAELARLKGMLAQAQAQQQKKQPGTIKVSAKGAVSVYGLGRFPTTLYAGQWRRLFAMGEQIEKFIQEHEAELSWEKGK